MMKRIFLCLLGCLICGAMKAQHQQLFDEFRQEVGDQAEMFSGKVEPGYSSIIYANSPYLISNDFLMGDVVFNGLSYRGTYLRYDAYLKQLVVNTPVKHSNVYVPMDLVEKFTLGGIAYERRNGEFMAILYSSPRVELVEQVDVQMEMKIVNNMTYKNHFKHDVNYYVLRAGQMYEVSKLKSVQNLYPGIKKELKRFAKEYNLDFKEYQQFSLISIIKYADELLGQP